MRKLTTLFIAVIAIMLLSSGVAYANFGPHGAYVDDTDACAACHRAHTSFADLGWVDFQGYERDSALLVSDADTMTEFCYACHGDDAIGASTNVESGVFDTGPTTELNAVPSLGDAPPTSYRSFSSYDATLNGGGFEFVGANPTAVASTHGMEQDDAPIWASTVTEIVSFRCTSCHDPHGSSNYRILKDALPNGTVGGYDVNDVPDPFVISNEYGYPQGGWQKAEAGVAQMADYRPSYTSYLWATNGKNMSAWCAGCHTGYDVAVSNANYGEYEQLTLADLSNDGDNLVGDRQRHRHLVDVPFNLGVGPMRALNVTLVMDPGLPLEAGADSTAANGGYADSYYSDVDTWMNGANNVTCLTCHYAHGSTATMSGWSVAQMTQDPAGSGAIAPVKVPSTATTQGVDPNHSEALLRYNERGVCERCHNKG